MSVGAAGQRCCMSWEPGGRVLACRRGRKERVGCCMSGGVHGYWGAAVARRRAREGWVCRGVCRVQACRVAGTG